MAELPAANSRRSWQFGLRLRTSVLHDWLGTRHSRQPSASCRTRSCPASVDCGRSRQIAASRLTPHEAPRLSDVAATSYARLALGESTIGLRNRGLGVRIPSGVLSHRVAQLLAPQALTACGVSPSGHNSRPRGNFRRSCWPMLTRVLGPVSRLRAADRCKSRRAV